MGITKLYFIAIIILVIAAAALGALVFDFKKDLVKIQKELEHVEEEVHEVRAAAKRTEAQENLSGDSYDEKSNQPKAIIENAEYDFGKIEKSGGIIKTKFTILNAGLGDLLIGDITTSCSCTSAEIDKKKLADTERAILTVSFDPNVHEEPAGKFSRSIFVPINDPAMKEIEFKIFVEIENN